MPEAENAVFVGGLPAEIRFQLRSNSQELLSGSRPGFRGRLPRITQVLSLAIYFDEMIRSGDAVDYADIARLTCLSRERVSQIMRLNYLAPDIQLEILYLPPGDGSNNQISEAALRGIANRLSWCDQRTVWARMGPHKSEFDASS